MGGLTVWVVRWLDAHVGLSFVQSGLSLATFLLHGGFGATFGIDVCQVSGRVVVGLQAFVIFNLRVGEDDRSDQGQRGITESRKLKEFLDKLVKSGK